MTNMRPPLLAPSDSAKTPPKFSHENLGGQVDESVSPADLFIKFLWEEPSDFAESDGVSKKIVQLLRVERFSF